MDPRNQALIDECCREQENCKYTSTALHSRLGWLQMLKNVMITIPLLLSCLAGWYILTDYENEWVKWFIAVCSLLAGVIPAVYAALKWDDQLSQCQTLTGEFKNLQHDFRYTANIASLKSFEEFEAAVLPLRERMSRARRSGYVIPDRDFKKAQAQIKTGDLDYDHDLKKLPQG